MKVDIPDLARLTGGPMVDPTGVGLLIRADDGSATLVGIEAGRISWLIAQLARSVQKGAPRRWPAFDSIDDDVESDTNLCLRATEACLIETTDTRRLVNLAIDVGPVRFRFAVSKSIARALGEALLNASRPARRHD